MSSTIDINSYIREKRFTELGLYYRGIKNYKLMKKYYELAIKQSDLDAMNNLGYYYFEIENKYEMAKKYLELAVSYNYPLAMNNLGLVHYNNGYYDQAKHCYLKAIGYDVPEAYNNLGIYYQIVDNNLEAAKMYYLEALKRNENLSQTNFKSITTPLERYILCKQYEIPFKEEKNRDINIFINKVNTFGETKECPICFESYTNIPLECCHYFCVTCYANLLKSADKRCPICRIEFFV